MVVSKYLKYKRKWEEGERDTMTAAASQKDAIYFPKQSSEIVSKKPFIFINMCLVAKTQYFPMTKKH